MKFFLLKNQRIVANGRFQRHIFSRRLDRHKLKFGKLHKIYNQLLVTQDFHYSLSRPDPKHYRFA